MNCDPIAHWYRWLEYAGFGRALERRRLAFLPEVAKARRALVLGDGDGRFLVHLVNQNRDAAVDYIDLSIRMLELARARAGDRVTYHHADALTMPLPAATYDLITTHFFLDCFDANDLSKLLEKIARSAGDGAIWLVSEFRQPRGGLQALWARLWLTTLYAWFGVATGLKTRRLVDHRPLLEQNGFTLLREQSARFGLLASELWIKDFQRQ